MNEVPPQQRTTQLRTGASILLVVLLSIFLIVGLQPQPEFGFLEPAHVRYVNVGGSASGLTCVTSYMLQGSFFALEEKLGQQLGDGWIRHAVAADGTLIYTKGPMTVSLVKWNFGTEEVPSTHILVERPARAADVPRSLLSKLRSWF
jgi:hypothetical protein